MAETILLDPLAVALNRAEVDITEFISAAGVDWGDAQIQAYMGDLAVGSNPVDYRLPNRQVKMSLSLRDVGATTFDQISGLFAQKVALFQREGGWLARIVDGVPLYADVVNATLHLGGDWLVANRAGDTLATLELECLPDFYGDEVTLDMVSATADTASVLLAGGAAGQVQGDHPGRVRIQVTDSSGQAQHGVLWGFRQRYYSAASSSQLVYEAEALQAAAGASSGALTGASGGTAVTYTGLTGTWADVVTLALADGTPLTHYGSYRVLARCQATGASSVRLSWGVGNTLPRVTNDALAMPGTAAMYLMDLGVIRLDKMPIGPHSWSGSVQGSGAGNLSVDKVYLQPLSEFAGRLTVPYSSGWPDAVIVASSLTEIRHDGCYRQSGVNWGPVQFVTGDLPRLPPAGAEARSTELFVKVTRGDFAAQPDAGLDAFTAQVRYRPTFLFRP